MPFASIRLGIDPQNPKTVFDYLKDFFIHTGQAFRGLGDRLVVEVILVGVTRALEGIRNGVIEDRPDGYPQSYDRIQLSNIPDYVGGTLFTYIYVLPLLKDKSSSFALANNCRNEKMCHSIAAFKNEYTTLHTDRDLENLLDGQTVSLTEIEDVLVKPGQTERPIRHYYAYRQVKSSSSLSKPSTRENVEHWLHAMFLKIAVPVCTCQIRDNIYAPLNTTIFFRLLIQLHKLGYPSHWLSDILTSILDNQLHTTARFLRTPPLIIAESEQNHDRIQVDIAPILPEFRTLTAMWLAELSFVIAGQLRIPHLSDIKQYTIRFTEVTDLNKNYEPSIPALTLLLIGLDARSAAMA
jgi:hypothetical protein